MTNFVIQRYHWNETLFKGVYSRNNFPDTVKDGIYITYFGKYKPIETQFKSLFSNGNNATSFDSFKVEHIPEEIKKFFGNRCIITNIYRI